MTSNALHRRDFLRQAGLAGTGLAAASVLPLASSARESDAPLPMGKAEHCIMIWLGGGACHIDMWDPKRLGDAKAKKPGSYYPAIDTAIPGTQVCEHLPRCAAVLDRFNIIRTVHHEVIDEHAAATNRMHTGRPTSGTVIYPSIGSIVAHQRGAVGEGVPAYILIGYPNVTRGPGFLGAKYNYVYLTDTQSGPSGFTLPPDVSVDRQSRRERLLAEVRGDYLGRAAGTKTARDYDATIAEAMRTVRAAVHAGVSTGQRAGRSAGVVRQRVRTALLAGPPAGAIRGAVHRGLAQSELHQRHRLGHAQRRPVEPAPADPGTGQGAVDAGVGPGTSAVARQNADLCRDRVRAPRGLRRRRRTRPSFRSFSVVLAGGGLQNGKTIGETDELGMKIESRPVSVPDLHATIHCALGIDPAAELVAAGDRPVPITDMGQPVRELF
jgi:hypothetical protein